MALFSASDSAPIEVTHKSIQKSITITDGLGSVVVNKSDITTGKKLLAVAVCNSNSNASIYLMPYSISYTPNDATKAATVSCASTKAPPNAWGSAANGTYTVNVDIAEY